MLVLRSSTTSPFARKIRIAISILGLEDEIRIDSADTLDPDDSPPYTIMRSPTGS